MEIKTVRRTRQEEFDQEVNTALADGWHLTKRELVPREGNYDYYAELVKLDPPAEPEQPDPLEALRTVRDLCLSTSQEDCVAERCPLFDWCTQIVNGRDPSGWVLPDGEVAT